MRIGEVEVEDTFSELFPMWVSRILITADDEKWARIAAEEATGFATSIIGSPAEAGVEGPAKPDETPDGRPGYFIHIYQRGWRALKAQLMARIGQCVLTCPTTAAFDATPEPRRRLRIGRALSMFGDGWQRPAVRYGRKLWRIPVMEGEFLVENAFGAKIGVAGGTLIIMAKDRRSGLRAAEEAAEAVRSSGHVILPFPGGICRAGSKVGSRKYKLPASTNEPFCPRLRRLVDNTKVPEGVRCVYELVINGLTLDDVKKAMSAGLKAAAGVPGVVRITSANYGGKLGPIKIHLRELI